MFAGIAGSFLDRSSRRVMNRCCCPSCCCCYCRCNVFANNGRSADRNRSESSTYSDEYTDASELGFASRRDNKLLPTKSKEILMRVGWNRTDSGGYECFLEYSKLIVVFLCVSCAWFRARFSRGSAIIEFILRSKRLIK